MKTIKIAIIVGKMDSGGKKNLIMEYYRHIDRDKIQFDFICDSDSQAIPFEEIEELGGRVFQITPYQHILRNMADMRRLFKENDYPIVHAYNSTMNLFPMAIAKYCRIPVRISESLSMAHEGDWKTVLKRCCAPCQSGLQIIICLVAMIAGAGSLATSCLTREKSMYSKLSSILNLMLTILRCERKQEDNTAGRKRL